MKGSLSAAAFSRHMDVVALSMQRLIPDVEKAGRLIQTTLKKGKKLLICGNGGSAADSQHFAAELTGRYKKNRRAYPAIALTTDTSALTAIGNDYGFEYIFSRQVEALGARGDILVAFSTSGKSKNILKAIAAAKKRGLRIITLTGKKGASLKRVSDVCIVVPTDETARIQEVHQILYHAWCEALDI